MRTGISRYWQGFNRASRLWRHVILHLLGLSITCASNQVLWSCPWMPRYVNLVPVIVKSCRLIMFMLVILISLLWFSHSIMVWSSISMLSRCWCGLQFHIHRIMTIVWLLRWWRLWCWLIRRYWWHFGGIWSIVGVPGGVMVVDVVIPIFSLFFIGDLVDSRSIMLAGWHVLRNWACQLMIPVRLS